MGSCTHPPLGRSAPNLEFKTTPVVYSSSPNFALIVTSYRKCGRNAATIPRYLIKNLKYGSSCTHPIQRSGPNFALICGAKYRHNAALFDKFSNLGAPAPTPFTDHNQFGMQEYIQVRPDLFIASPLAKTRNSTAFSTSTFCGGAT